MISDIKNNPAGGFNITVGGIRHNTIPGINPKVEIGDQVKKGQKISNGIINPHDILATKGITATQDYMSDKLFEVAKDFGIKRRAVETVISGMTNLQVVKDPGDSDMSYYDYAQSGAIDDYNNNRVTTVPAEQAVGRKLNKNYGSFKKGQTVDRSMVFDLKVAGHNQVEVIKNRIVSSSVLKPVSQYPRFKQSDWLAKMDFTHLKDNILDSAAQGAKSDIHGYNPISGYAYGAEFGKNTKPGGY